MPAAYRCGASKNKELRAAADKAVQARQSLAPRDTRGQAEEAARAACLRRPEGISGGLVGPPPQTAAFGRPNFPHFLPVAFGGGFAGTLRFLRWALFPRWGCFCGFALLGVRGFLRCFNVVSSYCRGLLERASGPPLPEARLLTRERYLSPTVYCHVLPLSGRSHPGDGLQAVRAGSGRYDES